MEYTKVTINEVHVPGNRALTFDEIPPGVVFKATMISKAGVLQIKDGLFVVTPQGPGDVEIVYLGTPITVYEDPYEVEFHGVRMFREIKIEVVE